MATTPSKITRPTLARYAGMLGRGSIAAQALATFDEIEARGGRPVALRTNNDFRITENGAQVYPPPVARP